MKDQTMATPKYKVEEINPQIKATDVCPECGAMLVVKQYGLYEEANCMGCGYTETAQMPRPY